MKAQRHTSIAQAILVLGTGLFAASAAQSVELEGYMRAGPGATSKGHARACYNLNGTGTTGAGTHYRLGNECDFYGEFGLMQSGTGPGGVTYKTEVMINQFNPGTDTGGSSTGFNQMYVEGKGFDFAPSANFWAGKRFYGRNDVHILDYKFTQLDGVGAGVDSIAVGTGQLGISFFRTDNNTAGAASDGLSTRPGSRLNVDLIKLPVNPGGQLRLTGVYTKGDFSGGTSGYGLSVEHQQADLFGPGSTNTVWLQYAQGSANLNMNFGNDVVTGAGVLQRTGLAAPSDVKGWRIVESFTWQSGPFGGQAVALYESDHRYDTDGVTRVKTDLMTLGGRASYAVTNNFKLVAELGHTQKKPDGFQSQRLTKFTFAPTLSPAPTFWSRPELRLYVTTAKWNDAANAANGAGGLTGLGNNKTSGTSYGAQAEIWF